MHHHPILLFLLLCFVVLYLFRPRYKRPTSILKRCPDCDLSWNYTPPKPTDNKIETATQAVEVAQPTPASAEATPVAAPTQLTAESDTDQELSQDHANQMTQALALRTEVKWLESQFAAIKGRLPTASAAHDDPQAIATRRECTIITEQLRIVNSNCDELMRFVMAPYQPAHSTQYVPTFNDAAWAFTSANLTLSFARKRIVALC